MKKLLLFASLTVAAHVSFAQSRALQGNTAELNLANQGANNANSTIMTFDSRYEGVKGSPYFMDSWTKSTITMADNAVYQDVEILYNVYANELLYRETVGAEKLLPSHRIQSFTMKDAASGKVYTLRHLNQAQGADPKFAYNFYIMLHDGKKAQLATMPQKIMKKANYQGAYNADKPYDELVNEFTYYVVNNNKMEKVKLNKKNLLKALSDKQAEVQAFLGKEKIDATTEDGWVKALAHYETL
ncbi:hypothetical protein [Pontibacter roseus]|uniref:hypothetical protein n=1 Tax=Pontibacter roseus TaxID=336989 RepID=UPI00037AA469|nr:hypothetical protein [Pontibacter roseus]